MSESTTKPTTAEWAVELEALIARGLRQEFDSTGRLVDKNIARASRQRRAREDDEQAIAGAVEVLAAVGIARAMGAAIGEATRGFTTVLDVTSFMSHDIVDTAARIDVMTKAAKDIRDTMAAMMESFGASAQTILKLVNERRRRTHVGCPPRLSATPLRRHEVLPRSVVAHRVSPRRNRAQSRPGGKTAARRAA